MPDFDVDAIAGELTEDGDSHEIESDNGTWTFRLQIRPDELSYEDMEDEEMFGKIAGIDRGRAWYDKRSWPEGQRPDGFTGAARKMTSESYGGEEFWYEPPECFRRFKGSGWDDIDAWNQAREAHERSVRSIVSWGYVYVLATAEHRLPDGYHHEWQASLGGVEAEYKPDYIAEVVHDVINELIHEIDTDAHSRSSY